VDEKKDLRVKQRRRSGNGVQTYLGAKKRRGKGVKSKIKRGDKQNPRGGFWVNKSQDQLLKGRRCEKYRKRENISSKKRKGKEFVRTKTGTGEGGGKSSALDGQKIETLTG